MKPVRIKLSLILFALCLILAEGVKGQVGTTKLDKIYFGPKIGFQVMQPVFKDTDSLGLNIDREFSLGYVAGVALNYPASKRVSLHTELYYSREGRRLSGGIDDEFSNRSVYQQIDLPILIQTLFERRLVTWHIDVGGNFSYWLSGRSSLKSIELEEIGIDDIDYKIKFNEPGKTEENGVFVVNIAEPNRIQVGLDLAVGLTFGTLPGQIMSIDLKYTIGHSFLAKDRDIDVGLGEYFENFRSAQRILSLNVAYMFEFKMGAGRIGKTTNVKRKRR